MSIARRFDLSNSLIHFFRNVDCSAKVDSYFVAPEIFGFGNIVEDDKYSSIFLLRSAIRNAYLWATWSYRKNSRAIYGPYPATCFSEMPIAAFLKSVQSRKRSNSPISHHALVLEKTELYELGARPVIYGLSTNATLPRSNNGGPRMIDRDVLPICEQYRYVTYNPANNRPVDWSHEREWRLPFTDEAFITSYEKKINDYGLPDLPIDIPGFHLNGSSYNRIGVIVTNEDERDLILHDMMVVRDRDNNKAYAYIIISDRYPDINLIIDPDDIDAAIKASLVDLDQYDQPSPADKRLVEEFRRAINYVESNASTPEKGEFGGCWLWLYDNSHPLTRALIRDDRIIITTSGKHLVELYEYNDSRSLRQREKMTIELAEVLKKNLGIEAGYHSVLLSDNPNGVPFYCSDNLGCMKQYNYASYHLP